MTKFVSPYLRGFFILFLLTFSFMAHAEEPVFKIVNSFGDERENYFFTKPGGIAFSGNKDIFVVDREKFSFVKFNQNGVFISRVGKKGKGPGDFLTPSEIQCLGQKLFIYDWLNHRIAVTGLKMEKFDYIKTKNLKDSEGRTYSMRSAPIVLDENRFLGINNDYSPDKGRLFTFDKNQRVNTWFFCDLPTDLDDEKWRIKAGKDKEFLFNHLTYPIVGVNYEKKTMLITFEHPDTTMRFYLYRFSGELIRRITYRQDEKYRFPMEQLDSLDNTPPYVTMVFDILSCKNYYLVLMAQIHTRLPRGKQNNFSYLFINEQGEIVHRRKAGIRYRAATPDGYLAGSEWDKENDLLKIFISKLNTKFLSKQKPISSQSP